MISSTIDSYRVLWRCHTHLTPRYRKLVAETRPHKSVHHLRSPHEIRDFLAAVKQEAASA